MEDIALSGIVRDASGTPIEGVSIVSGSSAATTNTDGFFEFDQIQVVSVLNGRSVVRFSKAGYFDVVRSMDADDDAADGASWEVVMCRKENNDFTSIKTYSSSSDQTLQAGEMKIDMPQDGYKVDGTGVGYTGKVKSEMVYLDPNNERFSEMMPGGDLAAVRSDNSSAQLVSYGMTDLNMYAEMATSCSSRRAARQSLPSRYQPEWVRIRQPASLCGASMRKLVSGRKKEVPHCRETYM